MTRRVATKQEVSAWLREETPEHMDLMTKLRLRIVQTLDSDITEGGSPSRDWCRSLQRYQASFVALMTEERERIKLRLMLDKSGQATLTDAEYEQELQQLAIESLSTVAPDVLKSELERRAQLAAEMPAERDEDEGD